MASSGASAHTVPTAEKAQGAARMLGIGDV
jgi:hypothetical protein